MLETDDEDTVFGLSGLRMNGVQDFRVTGSLELSIEALLRQLYHSSLPHPGLGH